MKKDWGYMKFLNKINNQVINSITPLHKWASNVHKSLKIISYFDRAS